MYIGVYIYLQAFSEVIVAARGDPISERFFQVLIDHGASIDMHDLADGGSNENYGVYVCTHMYVCVRATDVCMHG